MKFRPFAEARDYVHTLKLKNQEEWRAYSKSTTKPPDIPANPEEVYRKQWNGIGDWLGTGRIVSRIYKAMIFNSEVAVVFTGLVASTLIGGVYFAPIALGLSHSTCIFVLIYCISPRVFSLTRKLCNDSAVERDNSPHVKAKSFEPLLRIDICSALRNFVKHCSQVSFTGSAATTTAAASYYHHYCYWLCNRKAELKVYTDFENIMHICKID